MKLIRGIGVRVSVILILGVVGLCRGELRLLLSVFRHGDRYPHAYANTVRIYPLNPYANISWLADLDGELTMWGKHRSFELGKILRERYGEWLTKDFSSSHAEFRSAPTNRTHDTAILVAGGLFSTDNHQRWNRQLKWEVFPAYENPSEEETLYYGQFCSKYREILRNTVLNDLNIIAYYQNMQNLYKKVSNVTGRPVNNRIMYYLYIEHLSTISGGVPAWEWTEGLEERFKKAAINEYIISSWTMELKRYTGGLWLKKWLEYVDTYINHVDENRSIHKKAYFYGAHDFNIGGILTTLEIFYPHIPEYASAINFELHEDGEGQFYVRVLYKDSNEFIEQSVADCDIFCPLETFKDIFSIVVPSETLECGNFAL